MYVQSPLNFISQECEIRRNLGYGFRSFQSEVSDPALKAQLRDLSLIISLLPLFLASFWNLLLLGCWISQTGSLISLPLCIFCLLILLSGRVPQLYLVIYLSSSFLLQKLLLFSVPISQSRLPTTWMHIFSLNMLITGFLT